MSFPYMNAHTLSQSIGNMSQVANTTTPLLATGLHNMAQVPGTVDVSAMEFAFALQSTALTGVGARFLPTAISTAVFVMADGGQCGSGGAVLFGATIVSNPWSNTNDGSLGSTASPNQPVDAQGTSTTDLDSDDWLNLKVVQNGVGLVGIANLTASYVYGKPGSIA